MRDRIIEELRQKNAQATEYEKKMQMESDVDYAWAKPFMYLLVFLVVLSVTINLF